MIIVHTLHMSIITITRFKKTILNHHKKHGRHTLPWRQTCNPYHILVSEIMLQQTQVSRVLTIYPSFIKQFPTVETLAQAPVKDVLIAWQGLGYNRRALNLKRTAEIITREYDGVFPKTQQELESLPGIGQSTRGAILAFAYGIATPFIETNIRAVYIHHFFLKKIQVTDSEILPLIIETLDIKDPRRWYYALMDYGVYLKKNLPNPSRKSAHHIKQKPFKGSKREIRSRIVKLYLTGQYTKTEIINHIGQTPYNIESIIQELIKEGLIHEFTQ